MSGEVFPIDSKQNDQLADGSSDAFVINLSRKAEFPGGVFYESAIDETTAHILSAMAIDIATDPTDICYYEPKFRLSNGVYMGQPLIRKAWLAKFSSAGETPKTIAGQRFINTYGSSQQRHMASYLQGVVHVIDQTTGYDSDFGYLQHYAPRGVLTTHKDLGTVSRHLTLYGEGMFRTYDDQKNTLHTQPVSAGDLVVSYGDTFHSFSAGETGRIALSSVNQLPPDNS